MALANRRTALMALRGAAALLAGVLLLPLMARGNAVADGPPASATVFATVRVNPLRVELSVPEKVAVGENFEVRATVHNRGTTYMVRGASATLFFPDGLAEDGEGGLIIRGKSERNLGTIPPSREKQARWRVIAEGPPGVYVVMVVAQGTDEATGALLEAEASATITVVEGGSGPGGRGLAALVSLAWDAVKAVAVRLAL